MQLVNIMNICMHYRRTDGRTDIQQNENGCQDYLPHFLLGNNAGPGSRENNIAHNIRPFLLELKCLDNIVSCA